MACDYLQGRFSRVLVTGLSGRLYYETGRPLALIMRDELIARGVPSDIILVQDRSTNTLEDVAFSLDVLEQHDISPESIVFLCKAHHSGRCLRTLRKFFPSQTLSPVTYVAVYDGVKSIQRRLVSASQYPEVVCMVNTCVSSNIQREETSRIFKVAGTLRVP